MNGAGVDYNFIGYPGITHSVTNPGTTDAGPKFDIPLAYNKGTDEQNWNELKLFLQSLWGE